MSDSDGDEPEVVVWSLSGFTLIAVSPLPQYIPKSLRDVAKQRFLNEVIQPIRGMVTFA